MIKSAWPISRHFIWLLILVGVAACNLLSTAPDQSVVQNAVGGVPVVRLASPTANATYLGAVEINIQAAISNAGADIDRVEIVVDGAVIATYPQPNPLSLPTFSITQSWPITAVGTHTISATAYRSDGTSSAPANVTITLLGEADSAADQVTADDSAADTTSETGGEMDVAAVPTVADEVVVEKTEEPTTVPEPTKKPDPTDEPEEEDDSPMVRIVQGANIRSGPSTAFSAIGSLAAGDETDLLAVNPAGDWYMIKYWNGEGWIYASLVKVSGDVSNLTVDAGPATPAPTAVPPTAVPQTSSDSSSSDSSSSDSSSSSGPVNSGDVNYIITDIELDPNPLVCGETATITITVKNDGDDDASVGGVVRVKDVRNSSDEEVQRVMGAYPALKDGKSYEIEVYLTVSAYYNEKHRIKATVDYEDAIAETDEGDNSEEVKYELDEGDC